MPEYSVNEVQQSIMLRALESWLTIPRLAQIDIRRVEGSGAGRVTHKLGTLSYEEIAELVSPENILEAALDPDFTKLGGNIQLFASWWNDDGSGVGMTKAKTIRLTAIAPGAKTGSKGADAGTESMTAAFSALMTDGARERSTLTERLLDSNTGNTQLIIDSIRAASESSTSYQKEILTLQVAAEKDRGITAIKLLEMRHEIDSGFMGLFSKLPPKAQESIVVFTLETAGNLAKQFAETAKLAREAAILDQQKKALELELFKAETASKLATLALAKPATPPVPEPSPVPATAPEPVPAPEPSPEPSPVPATVPEPVPVPANPVPAPGTGVRERGKRKG